MVRNLKSGDVNRADMPDVYALWTIPNLCHIFIKKKTSSQYGGEMWLMKLGIELWLCETNNKLLCLYCIFKDDIYIVFKI